MEHQAPEITRVHRSRQEARAWYDTLSPWYGAIADPFERKHRATGLEMLQADTGERIVDVGCGTGSALVSIARSVAESGRAIGIDISAGMCRVARETVVDAGVSDRTDVVCGDALNLPVRSGSLDGVFASFTLELFDTPDIPVVLEECRRTLRHGGRICVVSLSKRDAGIATALYERVHNAFPRYVDCRPIYVRRAVLAEGFDVVETRDRTMWGLPVEIVLARV